MFCSSSPLHVSLQPTQASHVKSLHSEKSSFFPYSDAYNLFKQLLMLSIALQALAMRHCFHLAYWRTYCFTDTSKYKLAEILTKSNKYWWYTKIRSSFCDQLSHYTNSNELDIILIYCIVMPIVLIILISLQWSNCLAQCIWNYVRL
jgi:hypothetical protein